MAHYKSHDSGQHQKNIVHITIKVLLGGLNRFVTVCSSVFLLSVSVVMLTSWFQAYVVLKLVESQSACHLSSTPSKLNPLFDVQVIINCCTCSLDPIISVTDPTSKLLFLGIDHFQFLFECLIIITVKVWLVRQIRFPLLTPDVDY